MLCTSSLAALVMFCTHAAATAEGFPQSWQGTWKGDAEVRTADPAREPLKLKMELHVGPLEAGLAADPKPRRTWTIVYDGDRGRQERNYHLVDRDSAKGQYEIDERNSIVLPATLIGDALVCPFEVGGNLLLCTYRFDAAKDGEADDTITLEITTVQSPKPETTGGKDGAPEVKGYPVNSIQLAVLHRTIEKPAPQSEPRP